MSTSKKATVSLVLAIVALALAVLSLFYSFSDNAKIIGKWTDSDSETSGYSSYSGSTSSNTFEVAITGKLTRKYSYEYKEKGKVTSFRNSTTNTSYSIEADDNLLIQGPGTSTSTEGGSGQSTTTSTDEISPSIVKYYFVNGNKQILLGSTDGEIHIHYDRADFIPFYVLMQILAIALFVVCGIFFKRFMDERNTPGVAVPTYGAPAAPMSNGSSRKPDEPDMPVVPGAPFPGMGTHSMP